jgi:cell division protein FtsQ
MRSVSARSSKARKARGGRAKQPVRKKPLRSAARGKTAGGRSVAREGCVGRMARAISESWLIRRPMLVFSLLILFCGAGAGIFAGGYVSDTYFDLRARALIGFSAAGFNVEDIILEGNERTGAESVFAALGIEIGDSIFAADPAAIRSNLVELPWVTDAIVTRRYPDFISIRLIEKRPFALWQVGSSTVMVERTGKVIEGVAPDFSQRFLLLIGPGAAELAAPILDLLDQQRAVRARLLGVERISERRWDLILDRGIRVRLPELGWEEQLAELEGLIVDQGLLERDLEIIDLRFPDSYIFQLHNGDSRPVSRETPV